MKNRKQLRSNNPELLMRDCSTNALIWAHAELRICSCIEYELRPTGPSLWYEVVRLQEYSALLFPSRTTELSGD